MDDPRTERYTTDDVMRATEPVVAPVTPPTTPYETTTAPRVIDEPSADPMPERRATTYADDEPRRGFSALSSFFGWNVAAFWMLVLTGIVLGILGANAYQSGATTTGLTVPDLNTLAMGGIIGFVVAQFLAYLIGGIAAGRMARGRGVANGIGVAVWGLAIALLLGALAYALGTAYNLGYWLNYYGVNFRGLTAPAWTTLILTLIAMFLGGALGGALGARPYDRRVIETREERRGRIYNRGRPL